jgi:glycosyltransferase involved in cell wall biosynthesis
MVEPAVALSVVIPVYGSARILPELARQLEAALAPRYGVDGFEAVLVHDCGPDDAWPVIESLAAHHPWLGGVDLRMNAGQHNAVMAGLAHARGAIVVTMDDDLQHSPADIGALVARIEGGADVCYAHFPSREHATWKVLGSRFNDWVAQRLLKKPKGLYLSPFRAMRAEIRDEVLRYDGPFVYVDGLILQATRNIATVDVAHHARSDGRSGYSFRKLVSLWSQMATSFSVVPLRFVSLIGALSSIVGFVMAGLVIALKLMHPEWVVGWASMIVTVLILGGIQLLSLGAIGEYVGRVLLTLNGKPQYVVRKTVGRLSSRE